MLRGSLNPWSTKRYNANKQLGHVTPKCTVVAADELTLAEDFTDVSLKQQRASVAGCVFLLRVHLTAYRFHLLPSRVLLPIFLYLFSCIPMTVSLLA